MTNHMSDDLANGGDVRPPTAVWQRWAGWIFGIGLLALILFYGVRALLVDVEGPARLVVYAFSAQEEALTQGIFPVFTQQWETETGRDLTIEGVFGPSGTLAGQINLGAPADVVVFSNAQHVVWLQMSRRVQRNTQPVVVGWTPLVIVTRPGNPHDLRTFADLAQADLRLLHADPRSSGVGEWAVLAEYGDAWLVTGDRETAVAQLQAIWGNVRLLGASARATLTLFELGAGDALITYEQDARLAQERGVPLEIVIPQRTIVAEHVAVIVDDNVTYAERSVVQAFLDFLVSAEGQAILGSYYLRTAATTDLSPLSHSFTIADLGGWPRAYTELIEVLWQDNIEPRLNLDAAPMLLDPDERP